MDQEILNFSISQQFILDQHNIKTNKNFEMLGNL